MPPVQAASSYAGLKRCRELGLLGGALRGGPLAAVVEAALPADMVRQARRMAARALADGNRRQFVMGAALRLARTGMASFR